MSHFRSKLGQHAGEDLEPEVFLVAQAVGAALKDTDLVVQPFDEAQSDFVFGFAVGRNPAPVPLDQGGEVFVGFEPLPFELLAPVVEELSGPRFAVVIPELPEGLFKAGKRC